MREWVPQAGTIGLGDEKYVSVTTFRRSDEPVSTPSWIMPLEGDQVGFWTSSASGKATRVRKNPRVTIAGSDARGLDADPRDAVEGTALLASSGLDLDAIRARLGPRTA